MSEHTKGRLVVKKTSDRDGPIFKVGVENDPYNTIEIVDESYARRLAACWNACEGINIDALEKHASGAPGLRVFQAIGRDTMQGLEIEKARDLMRAIYKECGLWEAGVGYTFSISEDCEELVERIRTYLDTFDMQEDE